jgi:hypothetical protein
LCFAGNWFAFIGMRENYITDIKVDQKMQFGHIVVMWHLWRGLSQNRNHFEILGNENECDSENAKKGDNYSEKNYVLSSVI